MSRPVVQVCSLSKSYGSLKVVDGISFNVGPGEIFALLGPNGAGKTTTLECIEGLRKADSGSISIAGINPAREFRKLRRLLGVQLQSSALPEIMTVDESIKIFCLYYGIEPRYDLLDSFDLMSKLKTQFGMLSTGQQRKLALALALSHNPPVVILDEPTAGLDVSTRAELHNVMKAEREKGTAILLASHDMSEVEELADEVAILLNGHIAASGTPTEIITSGNNQVRLRVKTAYGSVGSFALLYDSIPCEKEGYTVFTCTDMDSVLYDMLIHIRRNGDRLVDLVVERPSLEERFLDITRAGGSV